MANSLVVFQTTITFKADDKVRVYFSSGRTEVFEIVEVGEGIILARNRSERLEILNLNNIESMEIY